MTNPLYITKKKNVSRYFIFIFDFKREMSKLRFCIYFYLLFISENLALFIFFYIFVFTESITHLDFYYIKLIINKHNHELTSIMENQR